VVVGCVYAGSTVVVYGLSFLAGDAAALLQYALGWLLTMGYLVVIVTPRASWPVGFTTQE
jgi:hypothetical protein